MKKTKIALILSSALLATACSTTTQPKSNYDKKFSNVEFRTNQQVKDDVLASLKEGAEENARQFKLLNDLTNVNRNDTPTRNNVNQVKGIEADVQVQSKYHPQQVLTAEETFQMLKEGDTSRTRPLNYGKVLPVGSSVEPVSATNVQNKGIQQNVVNVDYQQKYATQPNYVNMKTERNPQKGKDMIDAKLTYSHVKSTPITPTAKSTLNINGADNTSRYLGMPNIMPQTYQTTNGLSPNKMKETIKENSTKAKQNIVKAAYNDFEKNISLPKGKYEVNDLLARVAKDTNYQLQIEDPKNIGKQLEVNIDEPFKGTYTEVLKAISSAINGKGVGKLFINSNAKKIRISYNK